MRVQRFSQLVRTFVTLILATILAGCGGGATSPSQPETASPSPADPVTLTGYAARTAPDLDTALALDTITKAAPPAEVDAALWDELTAELSRVIATEESSRQASIIPSGEKNRITDLALIEDAGDYSIQWSYVNIGDYNRDGQVNVSDLTPVGMYYGAGSGDANWDVARSADGNNDGLVTVNDITPIGQNYNASVAGYNIYGRNADGRAWSSVGTLEFSDSSAAPTPVFAYPLASVDYAEYFVAPFDFSGDDSPQVNIASNQVTALNPGTVTVAEIGESSVTLEGDVPVLEAGQYIVASEGQGLLREIVSVTTEGSSTVVETAPASIEDAFDYLRLDEHLAYGFDQLEGYELAEGVELVKGEASSVTSRTTSEPLANLTLKIGHKIGENFEIAAQASFIPELDIGIEVGTTWEDLGELKAFWFEPNLDVNVGGSVKVFKEFILNKSQQKLCTLRFPPSIIIAGVLPVVFTTEIEVYLTFEGKFEIAVSVQPEAAINMWAGVYYDCEDGWSSDSDLTYNWKSGMTGNITATLTGEFGLFGPELEIFLYGVTGPFVKADAPYIKAEAQAQFTPDPKMVFKVDGGIRGSLGAEAEILGKKLARYETGQIFDLYQNILTKEFPFPDKLVITGVVTETGTEDGLVDITIGFLERIADSPDPLPHYQQLADSTLTDAYGAYAKTVEIPEGDNRIVVCFNQDTSNCDEWWNYDEGDRPSTEFESCSVIVSEPSPNEPYQLDALLDWAPGKLEVNSAVYWSTWRPDRNFHLIGPSSQTYEPLNGNPTTNARFGENYSEGLLREGEYTLIAEEYFWNWNPGFMVPAVEQPVTVIGGETKQIELTGLMQADAIDPIERIEITWDGPALLQDCYLTCSSVESSSSQSARVSIYGDESGSLTELPYAIGEDQTTWDGEDVEAGKWIIHMGDPPPALYDFDVYFLEVSPTQPDPLVTVFTSSGSFAYSKPADQGEHRHWHVFYYTTDQRLLETNVWID